MSLNPRRFSAIALGLLLTWPAAGCRKSQPSSAEQRALERHQREVRQTREWQAYFSSPQSGRTREALGFLQKLAQNRQLLGVPKTEPQVVGFGLGSPVVSSRGPYYWSQQFTVVFRDTPPRHCHYLVVQPYPEGDFQLQKAWRSDDTGKIVEESPIVPAPPRADPRRVFLGPANAGAERGWSGWFNGVLGGGSVAIGTSDPATGLNCFEIGITNPAAGQTHHADIRSVMFPLGHGRPARGPFTFSFAYKLPAKVKPGDNIEVNFRFFGKKDTDCLDQQTAIVGSKSGDSEMKQYKTMTLTGIMAPKGAVQADVWIVANIASPWTSGMAQFDDFSVTAVRAPTWIGLFIEVWLPAALALLVLGTLYLRWSRRRALRAPTGGEPPSAPPEVSSA